MKQIRISGKRLALAVLPLGALLFGCAEDITAPPLAPAEVSLRNEVRLPKPPVEPPIDVILAD